MNRCFLYLCFILSATCITKGQKIKQFSEDELLGIFEKAKAKLPESLRVRVADVKLRRARDLGIGPEMPLEYRLLNRAAFASFSVIERELKIYDAGAMNLPTWAGDQPGKEEVAKLLGGVADAMGMEDPGSGEGVKFSAVWEEFVRRVYSWGDREMPEVIPAVDDQELWNRFLQDGVKRLMGGEVPMEELMVHELGHALQLEEETMSRRMAYWAGLSGFVDTRHGELANGFVGGMNKMEEVMVLMRLLLADEADQVARGGKADFAAATGARFVNRYARYDLREDYAESFRLMAYRPEVLLKFAPEKFLYLNALGWNARLDLENPGPLWYAGEEFERLVPQSERVKIFSRLLGKDRADLALGPIPMAAILRAHAEELTVENLPQPHPVLSFPEDLPVELRQGLDPKLFGVKIGELVYSASVEKQRARQDELISAWIGIYEYEEGMQKYRVRGTGGISGAYRDEVVREKNPSKRCRQYETLRAHGLQKLPADTWRKWDLAEAEFHRKNGHLLVAARFAILGSQKRTKVLLQEIATLTQGAELGFERSHLLATAVDLVLPSKDPELIEAKIKNIPGMTLGKWLRVMLSKRAAKVVSQKEQGRFLEMAKVEIESCRFPKIRRKLELMMEH